MPGVKTLLGFLKGLSTLQLALGVSVLFHATLLTIRFVDPEGFNRVFQDTPLEVILVNAKSDELPQKAMAIAQASLAGGGDAAQGRATSPLPPSPQVELGDTAKNQRAQIAQLMEMQQQLLAQVRRELALLPPPDPRRDRGEPEAQEQADKRRRLVQLMAEIEKRINDENARPKKRYISPATREVVYAQYYDQLRRRIEARGTRDFPEHQGRKLYGELVMNIHVDHRGRVVETGPVDDVFALPTHPYTRGLLASLPDIDDPATGAARVDLVAMPGLPPDPVEPPAGCAFAPRCPIAHDDCVWHRQELRPVAEVAGVDAARATPDHLAATRCPVPDGVGTGSREVARG